MFLIFQDTQIFYGIDTGQPVGHGHGGKKAIIALMARKSHKGSHDSDKAKKSLIYFPIKQPL